MACEACEWELEPIYEDSDIVVVLSPNPTNFGHTIVMPKEHYTIMEHVPDEILEKMAVVVNKMSIKLFESLNIQGTNLLVQNGVDAGQQIPHFMIHIIPRLENDGIDFSWDPRQLGEEEMSTIEMKIKKQINEPVPEEPQEKETVEPPQAKGPKSESDNYLIRQLRRIP